MSEWKPRRRPKHAAAAAKADVKNKVLVERCEKLNSIILGFLLIGIIVMRFMSRRIPDKTEALIYAVLLLPVLVLDGYKAYVYINLPKADRKPLRGPYFRTPVTDFITCVALGAFLCYVLLTQSF